MTKFENQYAEIVLDENSAFISLIFKNRAPEKDFVDIAKRMLEEFKSLTINKILIDARHMGIVGTSGQEFIANVSIPAKIEHVKGRTLYIAHVLPKEDVFAKVSANNIEKKGKKGLDHLDMQSFFSSEDAIAWLLKQN